MKKHLLTITSNTEIARNIFEMKLTGPGTATMTVPGQFLHVSVGNNTSKLLRRPLSICDVDLEREEVTLLYRAQGEGTKQLSQKHTGETVDVLGPLGNGFSTESSEDRKKALLIGGGIGVPPLYYLGKKLKDKGIQVTFILGFQSLEASFYIEQFQEIGETIVTTVDGSLGLKGFVTDAMDQPISDEPLIYSVGPAVMLKAVEQKAQGLNGFISLEERMGCGVGACFACVCPTETRQSGYVKICSDGPVFKMGEVVL
ncbi:dihydroorotate dehydrogenase electron transfer subunit [Fictibacillus phosphorivorans]|uniref:dihydroorotate dehydrogenase electron transfer subunit n=1 Tax=Fictibacillus phosphorivorans TaxID=1221500 RepID=UPI00203D1336|nr:dihydroorotate dehydrogenase electron transfer subunit [Fictibacillus phosphorivorans]MCM3717225.1 dihydroorotate dehydrogenase electron transfer subunit [Fictibacillus phosphorivorans]MCM3774912.1 dihydroorotate dehydrogenase electron transfer subunit [Fictibacillus phosphorivorans]